MGERDTKACSVGHKGDSLHGWTSSDEKRFVRDKRHLISIFSADILLNLLSANAPCRRTDILCVEWVLSLKSYHDLMQPDVF